MEEGAICELKIKDLKANDFDTAQQLRLSHILYHMKTQRRYVMAVEVRPTLLADPRFLQSNYKTFDSSAEFFKDKDDKVTESEHDPACSQQYSTSLHSCFKSFSKTESLSGTN